MFIRPMSDLHLDFLKKDGNPWWHPTHLHTDEDTVLVLAGDVAEAYIHIQDETNYSWLQDMSERFKAVIWVAGNHDFWHCPNSFENSKTFFNELELRMARDNFFYLSKDCDPVIIDGVKFIGDTLWTNFNKGNPNDMWDAQRRMNDYNFIQGRPGKRITPEELYREHQEAAKYIADNIAIKNSDKTVVVSHHSPSFKSAMGAYRHSRYNHFYHSDLDNLTHGVDLWIHGHTHESKDYIIEHTGCRVVCNPAGYPVYKPKHKDWDELGCYVTVKAEIVFQNKSFNEELLIEI